MAQVIWITGRPGTGKTTLAKKICNKYKQCILIDSDEMRWAFGNQRYDEKQRHVWVWSMARTANLLMGQGFIPVVAIISPYKEIRERVFYTLFEKKNITLIYLPGGEDRMWENSVYENPTKDEAGTFLIRPYSI